MFKKRQRTQAVRKQESDEEDENETKVITAVKKKRVENNLSASSKKTDAEPEWKNEDVAFVGQKSSAEVLVNAGDQSGIFRVFEPDASTDADHRAVLERNQEIHEKLMSGELEKGVYRGQGAYKQIMSRPEGAISRNKSNGLLGPVRGNLGNVKCITRFDYWGTSGDGGVCKDYKETGYCGYGDSCIYMHDRSDYKSGWQLDREFEAQEKMKRDKIERRMKRKLEDPDAVSDSEIDEDSDSDEDKMPPDCQLCRDDWAKCESDPVVTSCKHYFCENCAMEKFQETRRCAVCNTQTNGIFNNASSVLEKARLKREEKLNARKAGPKRPSFAHNVPYQASI